MNKNTILVMMQGLYGNKVLTEISENNIDYILQGILDKKLLGLFHKPDRSIVEIPNSNCVLVYDKYQEEEQIKNAEEFGYSPKPLVIIPALNIKIYSRCFVCRISDNGKLTSLENEDIELISNYLL